MGYDQNALGSGCGTQDAPTTQNIASNLGLLLGTNDATDCTLGSDCLYSSYWSSTEDSDDPTTSALFQFFQSGSSPQYLDRKDFQLGVRCARALS